MTDKALTAILSLIGTVVLIELIDFGFGMMTASSTISFYLGLTLVLSSFSTIGIVAYKSINSIINSNKNKQNEN